MGNVMTCVGPGTKKAARRRQCLDVLSAQELKRSEKLWRKGSWIPVRINRFNLLPVELVNDILQWLPRRYLCVARAVCREWETMLSLRDFLSKDMIDGDARGESLDGPTLAFVDLRCDKQSFAAFNVELKCWVRVPSFYEGPKVEVEIGYSVVPCAKGLVVYNSTHVHKPYLTETDRDFRVWKSEKIDRLQFVVRNPLLGTTKVLPPTLKCLSFPFTAAQAMMILEVLDGSRGVQGYKITVFYPIVSNLIDGFQGGEIYDSRVGYWVPLKITTSWFKYKNSMLHKNNMLPLNKWLNYARTRHVVLDGNMYFVDYPIKLIRNIYYLVNGLHDKHGAKIRRKIPSLEHGHIIALNLNDYNWRFVYNMDNEKNVCPYYSQVMSRHANHEYDDPQLAMVCDKYLVFVVLRLALGNKNYSNNDLFWGWMAFLDVKSNKVIHRTIVPNKMATCLQLGWSSNPRYMVAGSSHYVCICNSDNRANSKMIAYDFFKKEWEEWPCCPFPVGIRENWWEWEKWWEIYSSSSLVHGGVSRRKEASLLMDYQLSYLPV